MKKIFFISLATFSILVFAQDHTGASKKRINDSVPPALSFEACSKAYKETANDICKKLRRLDLSPSTIKKVKKKINLISKSDNMWWSEERVKEAYEFLDHYQDTASNFKVTQELWCTLSLKKGDEFEKSQALIEERCKGDLKNSIERDSKIFSGLAYMFKNLAKQGLADEERSVRSIEERILKLRKNVGAMSVDDVNLFIAELEAKKQALKTGGLVARIAYNSKLKECYQIEKLNASAFQKKREEAPLGYDCASFDIKQNP